MSKVVKIGIIGCGAIAERLHVPDYYYSADTELVAFCDANKAQAQRLADTFAPDAKVYSDYKRLLKDPEVDAVSVCTPNVLHGPVSIAAAEAKKHVFVEKPMATSVEEAKKMIAAAKKNKVLLMVNQTQRRFNAHIKAKEVLDSGILGDVLYVIGMFGHAGPDDWSPGAHWFFNKKEARFGAMADLGIHKADIIRHLTGLEIVEIAAHTARLEKEGDVEDNFSSSIKFSSGAIGMLGASWTAKGLGSNFIIFHCSNGTLRVALWPNQPCVAHLASPAGEMILEPPAPLGDYPESWGVDAGGGFVRAVLGKEAPFCTGEDSMRSLAVIMAAEESAKTGKAVKVKY